MYLEKITIEGFRLFKSLDLAFNKGLNVLVGENDSGKTSLIDAIRLVLGSNTSDHLNVTEMDFHENCNSFTIQLKFSDLGKHEHRFLEHLTEELNTDNNEATEKRRVLYVHLNAQKTNSIRNGIPFIRRTVKSGKGGIGEQLDPELQNFLATTYLKPLRNAEVELSPGLGSRLSQILFSSKDVINNVDDILKIIAKANDEILSSKNVIKKSADTMKSKYFDNFIFEEDKNIFGVFIEIAGIRTVDLPNLTESDKRKHLRDVLEKLNLELTDDGKSHGLGYHNLLFMAAELLLLEQEVDNDLPLLLIEEPEAHLHPQLQMKLLQFIDQRVRPNIYGLDDERDKIQCILSTLSTSISSKVDPKDIILVVGGKAWSLRAGETELEEEDYMYLRKFLDATKANVFYSRGLLLVEGNSECILLPKLAELIGRPLENFGVSIVKCDNSGSWKRFARLFLRKDTGDTIENWVKTKVCILCDLDLWPDCAEYKEDGSNEYGFLSENKYNKFHWLKYCDDVDKKREKLKDNLEKQNVKINVSDDWTFEFCLAKKDLFKECYEAVNGSSQGIEEISGDNIERATYIQKEVKAGNKTNFAYKLGEILEQQQINYIKNKISNSKKEYTIEDKQIHEWKLEYAEQLKQKLPSYIVGAIEYVTSYGSDRQTTEKSDENSSNQ